MELNTKETEFKIIEDSKDEPTLESAQEFVGGYGSRVLTFPNGDYLIMNEEGKLLGLPLNPGGYISCGVQHSTKDKYL